MITRAGVKRFLMTYDYIWSVPVGALVFILFPVVGGWIFGEGLGSYDPSIIQAAIYTAFLMVVQNMVVQLGITFNHKESSREYYNHKTREEFKKGQLWEKINLYRFWYVFYSLEFILIWALLV